MDDEAPLCRALTRILAPHADVVAAHGVAAARAWLARGGRCDAVLCDVYLADGSGVELAAALAAMPDGPRVAMLTGAPGAAPAGYLCFAKPLDMPALVAWLTGTTERVTPPPSGS